MTSENWQHNRLSSEWAMKSQVLNTVWCYISGEATGEISNWSPLRVNGFKGVLRATGKDACHRISSAQFVFHGIFICVSHFPFSVLGFPLRICGAVFESNQPYLLRASAINLFASHAQAAFYGANSDITKCFGCLTITLLLPVGPINHFSQ